MSALSRGLLADVKQLRAVDGGPGVVELPLPVRALYGLGVMRDAAAKIDHLQPPSLPVVPSVTTEYGRYVVTLR